MYLNLAKAQELVDSAIAEMGADYVYPNSGPGTVCNYVDEDWSGVAESGDEPVLSKGCIVGHAFINAGFDMETLHASNVNEEGSNSLLDYLEGQAFLEGYNEEARVYLALVQRSQDYGKAWGEANEQAKLGNTWSTYNNQWISAETAGV